LSHVRGKTVVVTGASAGLGAALAVAFAEAGAQLVLGARRQDVLDQMVADIEARGGAAVGVACDVRREADVAALFAAGMARFGRIDVLINNAGVVNHEPTETLSLAGWSEVIDTNLTGAFLCAREALRIMKRQGVGRMIHIGSVSGIVPRPDCIAYTASKFALNGLNHSLALEGRAHGIASSVFQVGQIGTNFGGAKGSGSSAAAADTRIGVETTARTVLAMADLPDHVNFFEGTLLPLGQAFLGRG